MELIKNDDNSYTCKECNFIFGKMFVNSIKDFDAYHLDLHTKVIKDYNAKRQTQETHPPRRFRDIGNAE